MNEKQLQLVTYEQAKRLKEAGFDWWSHRHYTDGQLNERSYGCFNKKGDGRDNDVSAPTVALALKFIYEKYGYFGYVSPIGSAGGIDFTALIFWRGSDNSTTTIQLRRRGHFAYYIHPQEALRPLLDELLTIIEKTTNK